MARLWHAGCNRECRNLNKREIKLKNFRRKKMNNTITLNSELKGILVSDYTATELRGILVSDYTATELKGILVSD